MTVLKAREILTSRRDAVSGDSQDRQEREQSGPRLDRRQWLFPGRTT
jgi:hypothetical protein